MVYERLAAWRLTHTFALEIYRRTDNWPKDERFGLTSQLRRAALSVPTNIAEGAARRGNREFRRFLNISLGSLAEVRYLMRFSLDRGLLAPDQWMELEAKRNHAGLVTWRLYTALSKRVRE